MGSYENIIKIEELRKRMEEGDVFSAQKVLDTMDVKKVKNITNLGLMAEVYMENERYEEAAQLYLKIYDKTKTRKTLCNLIEVSIKRNNAEDAQYFLSEYKKVAPKDFYNYIFRYKIDKMKGEPYETLIDTLEVLKRTEYTEQWAYELAKNYYKAGMEEECIRECSDIVLWFGEGTYVEKAKILRSYYSGETDKEQIMAEIKRRAEEESTKIERGYDDETDLETPQEELDFVAEYSGYGPNDFTEDGKYGSREDIDEDGEYSTRDDIEEDGEYSTRDDVEEDGEYGTRDYFEEEPEYDTAGFAKRVSEDSITGYDRVELKAVDSEYSEEEIYSATDFMVEEETKNFEDELKRDIQDLLTQEIEEKLSAMEEAALKTERNLQLAATQQDKAEQEVEDTIYRLLEEEDMDEDDRKLSRIAEELMLNPEEIFGNFLHVKSVKKQLVKSLETILEEQKKPVQMIITGTTGSGKTTLAKDMALFLNQSGRLRTAKVAKIKAEKLNTIELLSKKDTLKDSCMVVENASELKRKTIEGILELTSKLQGDIAVIFEEDKKNMNKLFREYPKLMDLFKNRIHLPQYTQEDLIGFAYACLKQKDYCLNPKAEKKLINRIAQIAKDAEPYRHLEKIYDFMQTVMNVADIRTGRELSDLAAKGRLKDVEILSILPEDIK